MQSGLRTLVRGAAAIATALFLTSQASAGGMFREATIGEPPPLDVMLTTADVASTIGAHIFETLYAFDSAGMPQPMLADSDRLEDGGKTIVITLRQGVMFHNGKEMTADDVVASMKRWGEFGARGKLLMGDATSVEATGKYEVTLKLSAPERRLEERSSRTSMAGSASTRPKSPTRPATSRSSRPTTSARVRTSSKSGGRTAMSNWSASTATSRAARRPTASPAPASPISTRSASFRCRTSAPASAACRRATTTTPR